ncbi:MAG: hypothetical protein WD646_05760 [Actinomycetota bacterium]
MPTVEAEPREGGRWKAVALLPATVAMSLALLMPIGAAVSPQLQESVSYALAIEAPRKHKKKKVKSIPEMIRVVFGSRSGEALRVANCESRYDPDARSSSYVGVFQIHQGFHGWRIRKVGGKDLNDPMTNVLVAHSLMKDKGWRPWTCARMLGITGGGSGPRSRAGEVRAGRSRRYAPAPVVDIYPSFTYSGTSSGPPAPRRPRRPGMST